jgi:hypothetical protein
MKKQERFVLGEQRTHTAEGKKKKKKKKKKIH